MKCKHQKGCMALVCHGLNRHVLYITTFLIYFFFLSQANAQTINSNAVPVTTSFPNGSFESPVLPASPGYQYLPVVPSWTLGNTHAGLSRNGTAFTAGNPNTPQGSQVLIIQIGATASTTFTATAGYYRFSCLAAKRGNGGGNQSIAVSIDGVVFDTIRPTSTSYFTYKTTAVLVAAGTRTFKLEGLSVAQDNTAFVDDVKYEKLASWSAGGSWTGGVVPGSLNPVVIDAGEAMVLDVNSTVKSLHIQGEVIAARQTNLSLSSEWIMVDGSTARLDWGTATAPYKMNGTITLLGNYTGANINSWGAGEKFLGSRNFGTIEMHGIVKSSWTQLNATANAGTNTITLKDAVNWAVGDSIVIASTDFNAAQAEKRAILSISGGTNITLSSALAYKHYGATHTYNGLVLDERAEVGLLTHNIRIVGNNPTNGFGGHCMFLDNGRARFSGVELYNMGQKNIKGRYPFHWHELVSINGQYFQYNSVHNSFNRVLAIHNSDSGKIENNVAYNHIGHGFYLEDNFSTRNFFYRNLGILTKVPAAGEAIEPHDRVQNPTQGSTDFITPATFWINHPDNDFIENVAAGSDGTGFWYLGQNNQKMGVNSNNRSHSNTYNFTVDGNIDGSGNLVYGHFRPPFGQTPLINGFTTFKARERGIWTRGDVMYFDNCRLGDNPRNTFFAANQQLRSGLIVGKSPNTGTITTGNETTAGRSLARPNEVPTAEFNIFYGHSLYDGPSGLSTVHFAEFTGTNAFCFSIFAAAVKSPVHWAQGVTFDATVSAASKFYFAKSTDAEMMYTSGLLDIDGSLSGTVNAVITPKIIPNPFNPTKLYENGYNHMPAATEIAAWGAFVNPANTNIRLHRTDDYTHDGTRYTTYPQYAIRSDGPAMYDGTTDFAQVVPSWHQNPVVVNDTNYRYSWQRHKIPNRTQTDLHVGKTNEYVISVFPNMPSGTYVYGAVTTVGTTNTGAPLTKAISYNALKTSGSQCYFIANNTLYLKQIATTPDEPYTTTPFGHTLKSAPINICQKPNCEYATQTQEVAEMTFADFELGPDGRVAVSKTGALALPTVSYDATAASDPNDATNSKASWTITKVADAFDDYVDVKFTFPRQVWREFNQLKFNFTGVKMQVIVHEPNTSLSLGDVLPGTASYISLNPGVNFAALDTVVGLTLRIKESYITAASTTQNLFNIALGISTSPFKTAELITEVIPSPKNGITVAPNPASDKLSVTASFDNAEMAMFSLVSSSGKTVYATRQQVTKGTNSYKLELPLGVTPGLYILKVESKGSGIKSSKVTIVR